MTAFKFIWTRLLQKLRGQIEFREYVSIGTEQSTKQTVLAGTKISDVTLFRRIQKQICEILKQCRLLHNKKATHVNVSN